MLSTVPLLHYYYGIVKDAIMQGMSQVGWFFLERFYWKFDILGNIFVK